jgi:hypothetical protein
VTNSIKWEPEPRNAFLGNFLNQFHARNSAIARYLPCQELLDFSLQYLLPRGILVYGRLFHGRAEMEKRSVLRGVTPKGVPCMSVQENS